MRLHLLLLYRSTKVCKSCASPAPCTTLKQAIYIKWFIGYYISCKRILSPLRLPVPPSRPGSKYPSKVSYSPCSTRYCQDLRQTGSLFGWQQRRGHQILDPLNSDSCSAFPHASFLSHDENPVRQWRQP